MKYTGIVRKVDELGRIVIPKELRRTMGIDTGCSMEICAEEDSIILRKYARGCALCGSDDVLLELPNGRAVCASCARVIASKLDTEVRR